MSAIFWWHECVWRLVYIRSKWNNVYSQILNRKYRNCISGNQCGMRGSTVCNKVYDTSCFRISHFNGPSLLRHRLEWASLEFHWETLLHVLTRWERIILWWESVHFWKLMCGMRNSKACHEVRDTLCFRNFKLHGPSLVCAQLAMNTPLHVFTRLGKLSYINSRNLSSTGVKKC